MVDESEQYQVFYVSKEDKNTPVASQIRSLEQREVKRRTKPSVNNDRTKVGPNDQKFTRGSAPHYGRGRFQNRQRDSQPNGDRTGQSGSRPTGTPASGHSGTGKSLDSVRYPSKVPQGICVKCLNSKNESKSCHL